MSPESACMHTSSSRHPLQYYIVLCYKFFRDSPFRARCHGLHSVLSVVLCLQAVREIQNLVETSRNLEERKKRLTQMQSLYVMQLSRLSGRYSLCGCMLLQFVLCLTLCWFMSCSLERVSLKVAQSWNILIMVRLPDCHQIYCKSLDLFESRTMSSITQLLL